MRDIAARSSPLFGVHCQTVYGWVRKAKQGQLCAAKPGPKAAHKISETALRKAIDAHPDAMLKELARELSVHPTTIFYACRKWKITRKNVGL